MQLQIKLFVKDVFGLYRISRYLVQIDYERWSEMSAV